MSQDWPSTASLEDLKGSKKHAMLIEVLPHLSEGNTLVSHRPFADGSDLLASVGREGPFLYSVWLLFSIYITINTVILRFSLCCS